MSKYYDAMTRQQLVRQPDRSVPQTSMLLDRGARSTSLISLPTLEQGPAALARAQDLRNLSERLAPVAAVETATRVLVSGCQRRDGTSTVAAALAIDLSQRLGMRTLLVVAHLRHPSMQHLLIGHRRNGQELVLDGSVQSRNTDWPRLALLTCCPDDDEDQRQMIAEMEESAGDLSGGGGRFGGCRGWTRECYRWRGRRTRFSWSCDKDKPCAGSWRPAPTRSRQPTGRLPEWC